MPAGRPTDYNLELVSEICRRLSMGEPLAKICRDDEMPSGTSVYLWLAKHEEFAEMYARAKADSADCLADQIVDIADNETGDVQRDKLRLDARKWIAAKLKPKKYGERVEHGGAVDVVHRLVIKNG